MSYPHPCIEALPDKRIIVLTHTSVPDWNVFVKYLNGDYDIEMELNPEFAKSIENLDEDIVEVADAEFIDVDDAESEVIEEVTMEIINEEKE